MFKYYAQEDIREPIKFYKYHIESFPLEMYYIFTVALSNSNNVYIQLCEFNNYVVGSATVIFTFFTELLTFHYSQKYSLEYLV